MDLKWFRNDFWEIQSWFKIYFFLRPLGLPGGDQVDGLPPAAIRIGRAWTPGNYGTIHKFGADFLKKLSFSDISTHFSDFVLFFIDIAEAHAQGFAPL